MLKTDQFRKKLKVEIDGDPWVMLDVDFVRPGKGQGFVRVKMKNLIHGSVVERTYKSNETLAPAVVEDNDMQFLYKEGTAFNFMNTQNYEQVAIEESIVGEAGNYLYENCVASIAFYKGMPISVDTPNFVELEIVECEPGIKGNTATNTLKPAVVETGYRVGVPLFVDQGDWIRIDTRTGEYSERCKRPENR